jgi:hypothetical protein
MLCNASLRARPNAPERTAMPYSLQQAVTATGLNKSTILRAIKAGKVSAVRDEQGQWQVEPAELHRVYPPVAAAAERTDAMPQNAMPPGHQRMDARASALLPEPCLT